MSGRSRHQTPFPCSSKAVSPENIAFRTVVALSLSVLLCLALAPALLRAQDGVSSIDAGGPVDESVDESGSETEEGVQPSGMEGEDLGIPEDLIGEPFELSPGESEPAVEPPVEEAVEPSAGEVEPAVEPEEEEEFQLPEIEPPDFAELYDLSPAEAERAIFRARPWDPYYQEVVTRAPAPDITLLGPLPEAIDEDVEFNDVAADWIYHQKSVGLTELRGHVMVVYDTTIISSDEATLDEANEVYHFFGEGRVFVDDADFTLECDELEIHDAEGEKMIYILGSSTMVVYADEDAEEPGEDSSRRERMEYALKQQDTTITFTDAEYDYENDIFDAHGGVRFEQSDKYAEGEEFHGEDETDYMLFTGNCEFWQADGQWLYEHRVVEDREDPPNRGDKITRALLSVPTTITCDEAEAKGEEGWLQLRSESGGVVYFHQDDKHAECETFTQWYSEEEEELEPTDLLEEPEEVEEPGEPEMPPGFGALPLASDFPVGYVPWRAAAEALESLAEGISEIELLSEETAEPDVTAQGIAPESEEMEAEEEPVEEMEGPVDRYAFGERAESMRERLAGEEEDDVEEREGQIAEDSDQAGDEPEQTEEEPAAEAPVTPPLEPEPEDVDELPVEQEFEFEFPAGETTPPGGVIGSMAELEELAEEISLEPPEEEPPGERNEILMEGNVFFRQENGDWLIDYDIVSEEEETEEAIEQYRKWANALCDMLHVWTEEEVVEATGSVFGEQDNQDLACDYLHYMGELEMMYLRGNVVVHREGKHQLMSEEGFIFFTTNVFEALGAVQTTMMVDVEERRAGAHEAEEEEEEAAEEE